MLALRSHEVARELLDRPDDFLTVIIGDTEYSVCNLRRIKTHANLDDSFTHIALECKQQCGNMMI